MSDDECDHEFFAGWCLICGDQMEARWTQRIARFSVPVGPTKEGKQ